jgi:hypothetical protein
MAAEDVKLSVTGLREFRNAIKKLDAEFPRDMRAGFKGIAGVLASKIAGKVPSGATRRASMSVKPRADTTSASIVAGGSRAPYYPWLDFGGTVGRGHTPGKAFSGSISRPFIPEGRYIFPTIAANRPYIQAAAAAVLEDAIKNAGL